MNEEITAWLEKEFTIWRLEKESSNYYRFFGFATTWTDAEPRKDYEHEHEMVEVNLADLRLSRSELIERESLAEVLSAVEAMAREDK